MANELHRIQADLIQSEAKEIWTMQGRRSGKTVGLAKRAVKRFVEGKRVLYLAPTTEQTDAFFSEVLATLTPAPKWFTIYNSTQRREVVNSLDPKNIIRARTSYTPDNIRGGWADEILVDEYQQQAEAMLDDVIRPMLFDTNGTLIVSFTPPSIRTAGRSKAIDKLHAIKSWRELGPGVAKFHCSSYANPFISREAIERQRAEMSDLSFRIEVMAEDVIQHPRAIFNRASIQHLDYQPTGLRCVVGVDPAGSANPRADETGIVVVGHDGDSSYVLEDLSGRHEPETWAGIATSLARRYSATIVAERNFGGDMVRSTILTADPAARVKITTSTVGKAMRAEPVALLYDQGKVFHTKQFTTMETQMVQWVPGDAKSPDRLDALVFAITELALQRPTETFFFG